MCFLIRGYIKNLSPFQKELGSFHTLHHSIFSKFSISRHYVLDKNSPLSCKNTVAQQSLSVFIDSQAFAHNKKFICWINRKSFSDNSCVALLKRSNISKCRVNSKMVWISNLDNPKVKEKILK